MTTSILSEERQTHFAHVITDGLWQEEMVEYTNDEFVIRAAKQAIQKFLTDEDNFDSLVRTKIQSLKRGVMEGSTEWDILYQKYYKEEMGRRGLK